MVPILLFLVQPLLRLLHLYIPVTQKSMTFIKSDYIGYRYNYHDTTIDQTIANNIPARRWTLATTVFYPLALSLLVLVVMAFVLFLLFIGIPVKKESMKIEHIILVTGLTITALTKPIQYIPARH